MIMGKTLGLEDQTRPYKNNDATWHSDTGNFQDRGCFISPTCLNCPLPRCTHDDRSGAVRYGWLQHHSDLIEEVLPLMFRGYASNQSASLQGNSIVDAIAKHCQVHSRTVIRVI